ncbi:hypothetical protein HX804_01010 [Marine Group I thaumarchaeote]|uniref:PEFG-CTERM sorting domain-containing protein n=1 Tax=Marine Group I thaumarchaeote TaxID=2511932 RepID=A0A7K4NMH7_9ARCH|nr:hypothetical protein [Marine Group I thaumarchaeote]
MKAILLFVLSAIILSQSYGIAHAVHVSAHLGLDLEIELPITVATDSSSYEEGEMISVSGSVSDYIESDPYKNFDVTLRLIAPNNNIITISQIPLNSDGSYSTFIPAQGPLWKFDGDYTISVSWGSDTNASTTFTFILGSEEEVIEEEVIEGEAIEVMLEEELAKGCGPGTHLEDGICVLDETTVEPAFVSTGSVPTVGSTSLFYSITFTVLIAFAIMLVLYLISRGSRTKTA